MPEPTPSRGSVWIRPGWYVVICDDPEHLDRLEEGRRTAEEREEWARRHLEEFPTHHVERLHGEQPVTP
jgi:hypothetical protein